MFRRCMMFRAAGINRHRVVLNGSPGPLSIRLFKDNKLPPSQRWSDIIVTRRHSSYTVRNKLVHYMGKHVPHPQKSLWSPDTPVPQDRHLFKLTTLDIDAFKYFYGVMRADLDREVWELLSHSGLLPPAYHQVNYGAPQPVFDKEDLYRYYLKHRPSIAEQNRRNSLDYSNSMIRSPEERAARRPAEPWL